MDIHERLRILRTNLHLTARAFGAMINMSAGAITNMEKGARSVTERTIRDICREYHVNPDWLINGIEPMFVDFTRDLDVDEDVKQLVNEYSRLNQKDKQLVKMLVDSLYEKVGGCSEMKNPVTKEF